MKIFPAIDLLSGRAVRLYKGDYDKVTVYSDRPYEIAIEMQRLGAENLHVVDLDGAKSGRLDNIETIKSIIDKTNMFTEVGGGIRSIETIERYLSAGVGRVILGTAAVTDPDLLSSAVREYGERIAVGVDIKDGRVAIKGWLEKTEYTADSFCLMLQNVGVKTVICTDISKDGAMMGTNRELYKRLSDKFSLNIIASGGVSSISDVRALSEMGLYGAIIGKAYYTGAVDLEAAIKLAGGEGI